MAYIDYNLQFSTENKLPMKDPNYGKSIYDPIEQSTESLPEWIKLISLSSLLLISIMFEIVNRSKKYHSSHLSKDEMQQFERKYGIKLKPYIDKYIKHLKSVNDKVSNVCKSSSKFIKDLNYIKSITYRSEDKMNYKNLSKKDMLKISRNFVKIINDNYDYYIYNKWKNGEYGLYNNNNFLIVSKEICAVTFKDRTVHPEVQKILQSIDKSLIVKEEETEFNITPYTGSEICKDINLLNFCKTIQSIENDIKKENK